MIKIVGKIITRIPHGISFLLFYMKELFLCNIKVAHDVITPHYNMRPGVIAIPLDAENDLQVLFISNLITMTPGTMSLDVSDDKRVLYIHAMYIDDIERLRNEIKVGIVKKGRDLLR